MVVLIKSVTLKNLHQENVKVYSFLVGISKSISQKPESVGHFNDHKVRVVLQDNQKKLHILE